MPQTVPVRPAATGSFRALTLARRCPPAQESMVHVGPGGNEFWVTIFGFPPDLPPQELRHILREFQARCSPSSVCAELTRALWAQKCGEIKKSGSFASVPANWVHLCFGHADEAMRALSRNGQQLTNSLIIGVKPLDPRQRASVTGAPGPWHTHDATGGGLV